MRWSPWKIGSPAKREHDLAREIEAHLEAEAAEQRSSELSPEEARGAALRLFGNRALMQEEVRETWGLRWLDRFLQDLRYAARGLQRNAGFALVIILSLALGIGANTAIFSVLYTVLLRPLPVAHPEQLYALDITESKFRAPQRFPYPVFEEMRGVAGGGIAAMSRVARMYGRLGNEGEQELQRVQLVSGEYFQLLGLTPARGRFLAPEDNVKVGGHPVAVVSHAFWQEKLDGSGDVLGRVINLNGSPFTIVGVAPAGFNGLWLESPVDVWIPLMMQAAAHYAQNFSSSNADETKPWANQEGIRWLDLMVRTEANLPALEGVFQHWLDRQALQMHDETNRRLFFQQRLMLDPMARGYSNLRGRIAAPLYALAAMVALVLLIACANSANLILARGASRQREIGVRLSIGASRGRVIRQLLTESFLLVAIAAAAGVAAAYLASTLLVRAALGIGAGPSPITAGLDGRVLGFSLAVSILTALFSGLAPAFRATEIELDAVMKTGGRGVLAGSRSNPQKILVAAQIALIFVLVVGAAWFSGSLRYLARLDLGYDQEHVVTVWVRPELAGYQQEQLPALHRRLVEALEALPDVQSAVFAMCGLASGCRTSSSVTIADYQPAAGENVEIQENRVGPHYFSTVGMRLLAGRDFTDQDREKTPLVAIVNQAAVRRYFPDGHAMERKFGYGKPQIQIVGIVEDARVNSEREAARPMAFYPLAQGTVYGGSVEVRLAGDAASSIHEIREAVRRVDTNLPVDSVRTVRDQVTGNLRQDRLIVWLASGFGVLALGLACFGIYGIMSYTVARRTNEIGIRIALGAAPRRVFRMAFGESLVLLAGGLAAGAPLVLAASGPVSRVVFGVDTRDPLIFVLAALIVTATAALAAYIPARRASRVEAMVALRYE
jgi:predicted permease